MAVAERLSDHPGFEGIDDICIGQLPVQYASQLLGAGTVHSIAERMKSLVPADHGLSELEPGDFEDFTPNTTGSEVQARVIEPTVKRVDGRYTIARYDADPHDFGSEPHKTWVPELTIEIVTPRRPTTFEIADMRDRRALFDRKPGFVFGEATPAQPTVLEAGSISGSLVTPIYVAQAVPEVDQQPTEHLHTPIEDSTALSSALQTFLDRQNRQIPQNPLLLPNPVLDMRQTLVADSHTDTPDLSAELYGKLTEIANAGASTVIHRTVELASGKIIAYTLEPA